jgi:hypothetical protein
MRIKNIVPEACHICGKQTSLAAIEPIQLILKWSCPCCFDPKRTLASFGNLMFLHAPDSYVAVDRKLGDPAHWLPAKRGPGLAIGLAASGLETKVRENSVSYLEPEPPRLVPTAHRKSRQSLDIPSSRCTRTKEVMSERWR